jgi:peroxiredoxin Q/BCP
MALRVGDQAPDFDVEGYKAGQRHRLRLAELRGHKNVVLYFYPRDFTPVCTREACGFRDAYEELQSKDTEVIGVSVDDDASHSRFADHHQVPFALVSDADKELSKAYGAVTTLHKLLGRTARLTYVIDKQGRIAAVFDNELLASKHVDGARAAIAKLG